MAQTQTLPTLNVDVKPTRMESAYVAAPFDVAKEALEAQKYNIISLEQDARLRMQQGKDSYISRNGNWTREGFVYHKELGIYLTKNSPIMSSPVEATQAHRNENEFYLNDEQVGRSLTNAIQIPKKQEPIPTKRFGEDKITVFVFGDVAKQYGEFLNNSGIKEMPICLANIGEKPFARQMWFGGLGFQSSLGGYNRDLGHDNRLRGVRESGEAGSQNFSNSSSIKTYTPEQISRALKKANLSGIENILFKNL